MKYRKVVSFLFLIILTGCIGSKRQIYNSNFQMPSQYTKNHAWVGEKVIFLQKIGELQKYGYQDFRFNQEDILGVIPYHELAGKTAEIIGYKGGRYPNVVFKLDDSNLIVYTTAYGNNINDIGFISEMDNSKKYIGKTIWNKGHPTELDNRAMRNHINCSRRIGKFEKLSVVDVEWDNYESSPLKFILKTTDGLRATWSGSYSRTNDTENHLLQPFEANWYFKDPHILHPDWSSQTWEAIENDKIFIGMTKEQAILSWGEPLEINKTVGSWGVHEQWVYDSQYLYFENDILDSFQSK